VAVVLESYRLGEQSNKRRGLLRWPVKLILPVGFRPDGAPGRLGNHKAHRGARKSDEAEFKYEKPLQ